MYTKTKKIISLAESDDLVLSLEVRQVPIPILQTLFNNNLVGSELPIQQQRVKSIHAITNMLSATANLDLFIGLYEEYFLPPKRLQKSNTSANLIPTTPRKLWN
jgi:hypothetical protein